MAFRMCEFIAPSTFYDVFSRVGPARTARTFDFGFMFNCDSLNTTICSDGGTEEREDMRETWRACPGVGGLYNESGIRSCESDTLWVVGRVTKFAGQIAFGFYEAFRARSAESLCIVRHLNLVYAVKYVGMWDYEFI